MDIIADRKQLTGRIIFWVYVQVTYVLPSLCIQDRKLKLYF